MKPAIHEKGFGAEVSRAIVAREEWLIATGHARSEQPGVITPKLDMLRELNHRGITLAADKLSEQLDLPHVAPTEGRRVIGQHVRTIDLPMQRLAVIKARDAFTLLPLRPELSKMCGKEIEIGVHERTITIALARGPKRDLGLSR